MITEDMVLPVGEIFKPHGYKGEMTVDIFYDAELFRNRERPFFIKIDNILVPFFVESIGGGSGKSTYIKLKRIDSDVEAGAFSKKEIYALRKDVADSLGVEIDDLTHLTDDIRGYVVIDASDNKEIGKIMDFAEGVEYDYMVVEPESGGNSVMIPLIDDFVIEINDLEGGTGTVKVSLPEGFLEI